MSTRNVTPARGSGRTGVLLSSLFVIALVGTLVASLASAAEAQRGRRGFGASQNDLRGLGLGVLGMAEELELTDQQIQRLKDIRKGAPAKIMPKTQALMEARIEYRDLMHESNADSKAIRAAHARLLDAQAQLKSVTFDLRLAVRDVLTPEQRSELKQKARSRQILRRAPRLYRRHLERHGALAEPFEMEESFGFLDDELGDFGFEHFDARGQGDAWQWLEEVREEPGEEEKP